MTEFYLNPSFKIKVDHWNISVQWALRRYIYENLYNPKDYTDEKVKRKRQQTAQLGTVLVSALWHGIYPGYFISFVNWIMFMQIFQEVFRLRKIDGTIFHSFYKKYPFVYDQLENLGATFVMTYFGVPFHLMTWTRNWAYLKATLFLPYITLYILYFLIFQLKIFGHSKRHHINRHH